MIRKDFYIARLIAKHLAGELGTKEAAELTNWREASPEHERLFQKLCDEEQLCRYVQQATAFSPAEGWKEVQQQIRRKHLRRRRLRMLGYAAAIMLPILVAGIAWLYLTPTPGSTEKPLLAVQQIRPGSPQAILTLNDGQTIHIDKETGELPQQEDGTQVKVDSALLDYRTAEQNTKQSQTTTIYNKVETPRGGEYALLLSDGTRVHLNAMSRLRFPVNFGNGSREVELEGEAFFEVSKTGQPFRVNVNGMQVEVLGTTFNVSAYPGETYRTTLASGSVRVNAGSESRILKPDQQAIVTPGTDGIEVETVDAAFYTSWTRGRIHFKDQRLEEIMQTLSRWYDMKVVYADESLKDLRFGCHVNRYSEITPFVRLLEQTGKVHVEIKNQTITFHN